MLPVFFFNSEFQIYETDFISGIGSQDPKNLQNFKYLAKLSTLFIKNWGSDIMLEILNFNVKN